jgi:hypothetical protein
VMDQPARRDPLTSRTRECLENEFGAHVIGGGPSNHAAREQVDSQ